MHDLFIRMKKSHYGHLFPVIALDKERRSRISRDRLVSSYCKECNLYQELQEVGFLTSTIPGLGRSEAIMNNFIDLVKQILKHGF